MSRKKFAVAVLAAMMVATGFYASLSHAQSKYLSTKEEVKKIEPEAARKSAEDEKPAVDLKEDVASTDLDKESFEQSAFGPKVSAHAIAAEESAWKAWGKKWSKKKEGQIIGVPEVRTATVGTKIELSVFLATKDKAFEANEPLKYEVSIFKPDGSLQETMAPSLCMGKGSKLAAGYMGVCDTTLSFELEQDDPKGQWVFKIKIDAPGQKTLVFGTSFEAY